MYASDFKKLTQSKKVHLAWSETCKKKALTLIQKNKVHPRRAKKNMHAVFLVM
jgi:hypothetical protein